MTRGRKGFTLVELLVVAVLGSLVVGAALQVLIVNQRTYTAQNEAIAGQQTTRMALDVLFSELREASTTGGDIIAMSGDSIRLRLMRKFGFICDVSVLGGNAVLSVVTWGIGTNSFAANDSVFVFADDDEGTRTDDTWLKEEIDIVATTVCPQDGTAAQLLTFTGDSITFVSDSVHVGSPVRSFDEYTFGTVVVRGETYLGRRPGTGDMIPIAGPIRAANGLEFTYRDSIGGTTATMADVRQVEVIVRTGGDVSDALGGVVSDSISTWIYTRN